MNNKKISNVPEATKDEFTEIIGIINDLCKEYLNSFIIDARRTTYEIQEDAYNAGIIPYIHVNNSAI